MGKNQEEKKEKSFSIGRRDVESRIQQLGVSRRRRIRREGSVYWKEKNEVGKIWLLRSANKAELMRFTEEPAKEKSLAPREEKPCAPWTLQ